MHHKMLTQHALFCIDSNAKKGMLSHDTSSGSPTQLCIYSLKYKSLPASIGAIL